MTLCTTGHAERADDCPVCAALCDANEAALWADAAQTPNPGEPMYVYLRSEPNLWTVGFYSPRGEWVSESDHASSEAAAKRVAWLNGSRAPTLEPEPMETECPASPPPLTASSCC